MRLILVRHGETDSNKASLALGRDDVELNETGRWQAQRVADALRSQPIVPCTPAPCVAP
jgi:probable phosphoglycerate mutase